MLVGVCARGVGTYDALETLERGGGGALGGEVKCKLRTIAASVIKI